MYAGVYTFVCATLMLLLLGPISDTLVEILALPTDYSSFLMAGPTLVVGTAVWWVVVERRGAYTYPVGAVFGLLTALLTVLFWLLVFAVVWEAGLVLTGGLLIGFVLAVAVPIGLVVGLSAMYARRRLV